MLYCYFTILHRFYIYLLPHPNQSSTFASSDHLYNVVPSLLLPKPPPPGGSGFVASETTSVYMQICDNVDLNASDKKEQMTFVFLSLGSLTQYDLFFFFKGFIAFY